MGVIGVHIGLNSVNVTLKAMPIYNQSSNIDYNERFHWIGATQMKEDYRAALEKVTILCSGFRVFAIKALEKRAPVIS